MRWKVTGVNATTGVDTKLYVDADNAADAALAAQRAGLNVDSIERAAPAPAAAPADVTPPDSLDALADAAAHAGAVLDYAAPSSPQPVLAALKASRPETTFHETPGVLVTDARVIISGKTYPLQTITSVQVGVVTRNQGLSVFLLVGGAAAAVFAVLDLERMVGLLVLAFAVAALGLLFLLMHSSHYAVRIASAYGQTDAYVHPDRREVATIVDAINQAMVSRR